MNINIKGLKYAVISKTNTELLSQFSPIKFQYFSTDNTQTNIMMLKGFINP